LRWLRCFRLVLFCCVSVRPKRIGTEIIAAYSVIDENYFLYTRTQGAVKRKNFLLKQPRALEKVMDARMQNETLFTGVTVQHGRMADSGPSLAVEDDAGIQREKHDSGNSNRDVLEEQSTRLGAILADLSPDERLGRFRSEIDGRLVFTTSFGLEDQVILHHLAERNIDVDIVTLDTGRLFSQTYELWADTERRYGKRIRAFYPQQQTLEVLIEENGINGFYNSRKVRSACCGIRKLEPLNRALASAVGWIVGLRGDQSEHRRGAGLLALDERNLFKLSPLFDWTREEVRDFALANRVPVNPLHDQGFASIGCAPCTRAIAPGEPERAGRWWWEQNGDKECGLHAK
jgi:phosphoadenosine phosphosulfate reductase